jgi:YVTN family beta-propeller protein
VKVGQDPIRIDIDINTNKVYVTNYRSGSVSVIDGNTNKVLDNIELGIYPNEIVVNSNTSKIYVAHKIPIERPGYSAIDVVSVIDGNTNKVLDNITANGIKIKAVNEATNVLYFISNSGFISVIDGNTNKVLDNIELEQQPFDIAIDENTNMVVNPYTNRLYIVASINASLSLPVSDGGIDIPKGIIYIIDTKANKILSVLEVIAPRDIDINTSINRIYIINSLDKAVYSIDGYTNRLLNETMYIGNLPMGIAINSDTGKIYVADSFDNSIYIFSEVS